jgi:hypothetical protein
MISLVGLQERKLNQIERASKTNLKFVMLLLASLLFCMGGAFGTEPIIRPISPEQPMEEWTQERCEKSAPQNDYTKRFGCYGLSETNLTILRMCTRFPIDFNKPCNSGIPLHIAANNGSEEAIEVLISAGANPLERNFAGATALHVVLGPGYGKNRDNYRRVIRRLVGLGLSPNDTGQKGITPFTIAVFLADEQTIDLLIELGANVNQRDERGRMPLDIADDYKNTKKIALLEQHGAKRSGIPSPSPKKHPLEFLAPFFVGRH